MVDEEDDDDDEQKDALCNINVIYVFSFILKGAMWIVLHIFCRLKYIVFYGMCVHTLYSLTEQRRERQCEKETE